jgi:excisionase family DNA binding protein
METEPTAGRLLLNPEAAAATLSVSRSMLYDLMAKGLIDSIKVGRSRRITRRALEDFVSRLEAESAA